MRSDARKKLAPTEQPYDTSGDIDAAVDEVMTLLDGAARGGCGEHQGCRDLIDKKRRDALRRWLLGRAADLARKDAQLVAAEKLAGMRAEEIELLEVRAEQAERQVRVIRESIEALLAYCRHDGPCDIGPRGRCHTPDDPAHIAKRPEAALIYRGWIAYPDGSRSDAERWVKAADGDWISLDSTRRTSGDIQLEQP